MAGAMGHDDSEVFEINDFTVVTEFERFVAQLESVLHEWEVGGVRPFVRPSSTQKLKSKSADVKYKSKDYSLVFMYADGEPEDGEEEAADEFGYLPTAIRKMNAPIFDLRSKDTVYTQYGIHEHLLLDPKDNAARVEDQNTYKDLVSAFNVALLNAGCEIPLFVRIGDRGRNHFNGVCLNRNVRTHFEAIRTDDCLRKLGFFAGLTDMFREHVKCNAPRLPPIDAIVQFDYVYDHLAESEADDTPTKLTSNLFEFEIGDGRTSIRKVLLSTLWPKLNDETVNENEHFSDLDPFSAPRWFAEVKFDKNRKILCNILDELIDMHEAPYSDGKIFSFVPEEHQEPQIANALDQLTHGHSNDVHKLNFVPPKSAAQNAMIFAKDALERLFSEKTEEETAEFSEFQRKCVDKLASCKSAPRHSLTARLSILLAKCLMSGDDSRDRFSHVWYEFVSRISACFEDAKDIPGIDPDSTPEPKHCLLHQKLQMLQFCIATRRKSYSKLNEANSQQAMSTSTSSSEIFFDASDGEDEAGAAEEPKEPQGRLKATGLFLLKRPTEPIYVPITQDKGPMTDDMIDAQAQAFESISEDDRAKEQLDVLLSDMQAFKAANPGALVEDFIRWHSPRDWITPEEGEPHLSERMTVANNRWLDTWANARPIPVSSQKRLFNETKEAHAILQKFKNLSIRELVALIQPAVFHNVAHLFVTKATHAEPLISTELFDFCTSVVRAARRVDSEDFYEAFKQVSFIENRLTWLESFEDFMNKELLAGNEEAAVDRELLNDFILDIVRQERPVRILDAPNGSIALCIRQMMDREARVMEMPALDEDKNEPPPTSTTLRLPKPHRKHYIFRWLVPRPGLNSRPVPQRMYSCVGERHFCVSGAFSEDVTLR